jgi:hypothetical protein
MAHCFRSAVWLPVASKRMHDTHEHPHALHARTARTARMHFALGGALSKASRTRPVHRVSGIEVEAEARLDVPVVPARRHSGGPA